MSRSSSLSGFLPPIAFVMGKLSQEKQISESFDSVPRAKLFFMGEGLKEPSVYPTLKKMIEAMKLSEAEILFVDSHSEVQEPLPALGVHFEREWSGGFHTRGELKIMSTIHPQIFIEKPELKKEAWGHLQLVMKECDSLVR